MQLWPSSKLGILVAVFTGRGTGSTRCGYRAACTQTEGPRAVRAAAFLFLSSPRPRRWVPPEGRAAVPCPSLARGFPLTPTLPCPSLTVAVAEQRGTMRHGFGLGWVVCCSPFLPCQINDGPSGGKGGFGQARGWKTALPGREEGTSLGRWRDVNAASSSPLAWKWPSSRASPQPWRELCGSQ